MADQVPTIPVQQLPQLAELRSVEEDWTGSTGPAKRRKLQNRLNQRARREYMYLPPLDVLSSSSFVSVLAKSNALRS